MYSSKIYGTLAYGDDIAENGESALFSKDLLIHLPLYYKNNKLFKNLLKAHSIELNNILLYSDDFKKQRFVDTATEEGLALFEKELGIETDTSKPEYFRREKIRAKMQSRGTATKASIKHIAKTFANAEVDVIEDNKNFKFTIKFVGIRGIPPNMADLIETIEAIKPAHLIFEFEYTYTWWNKVSELNWNEANTRTWQQLRAY